MNRRVVGMLTVAAVAVAVTPALAGNGFNPEYGGYFEHDRGSYMGFELKGSDKHPKIKHLFTEGVAVTCTVDGYSGRTFTLPFNHSLEVKDGRFSGTGRGRISFTRGSPPNRYKIEVDGKIDGKRARGTMRLTQSSTTNSVRCYSGLLRWKGRKPAPPKP